MRRAVNRHDEILAVLVARRQATLAQLTKLTRGDYYAVWGALCDLRREGLVQPGIRYGQPGRWGKPVRYRPSLAGKRRLARRGRGRGRSR